jgi:UDP-N-acetylglucosamine diphosphorylase / glucose-1-phosphate thymidylyltransferase / UDP-N-acetylgalactosamine diphosphorylase / glucosamine-1-phosphate N-acetyltransferase / galactosamine-1-phosphate N-acetyltransferase
VKAVILAAGEGVRLLPVTGARPKHLVRVAGKPILQFCLEAIACAGIVDVVIVTHYFGDAISKFFGDGSRFGLRIEYVEQEAVLGTGNAVSVVEGLVDDDFVLVYGDLLFASDSVKRLVDVFMSCDVGAVLGVVEVDTPECYGMVEFLEDNFVRRIVEKPSLGLAPSRFANAGLYVFTKEIFSVLRRVVASVRGEWELTDALTLLADSGRRVLGVEVCRCDWFDVGRPWDLLDANNWALKKLCFEVLGTVEVGARLFGDVWVAKSARVRSGAYVEGPVFIGEGCDVGPNCFIRAGTSLGEGVRVGNACEIKNSIIMDHTHVGHLSYVGDSVLGERCNLGAGTIMGNYRLDAGTVKMMVKDQLVDTERRKLGAVLGDAVKTGINALFMPGVKVGQGSWVGPNFIVKRDLPANSRAFLE